MLSVTSAHNDAEEDDYFSPCDFQSSSRVQQLEIQHRDL